MLVFSVLIVGSGSDHPQLGHLVTPGYITMVVMHLSACARYILRSWLVCCMLGSFVLGQRCIPTNKRVSTHKQVKPLVCVCSTLNTSVVKGSNITLSVHILIKNDFIKNKTFLYVKYVYIMQQTLLPSCPLYRQLM